MDIASPLFNTQAWTGVASPMISGSSAQGMVSLGANARFVTSGVVIGGQIGVAYVGGLINDAVIVPGVSIGYAIPITSSIALTPAARAVLLLSTASGSSPSLQATGEIGAEFFIGKHAFIEPVVSAGGVQSTGGGTLIVGVGYRIGAVF